MRIRHSSVSRHLDLLDSGNEMDNFHAHERAQKISLNHYNNMTPLPRHHHTRTGRAASVLNGVGSNYRTIEMTREPSIEFVSRRQHIEPLSSRSVRAASVAFGELPMYVHRNRISTTCGTPRYAPSRQFHFNNELPITTVRHGYTSCRYLPIEAIHCTPTHHKPSHHLIGSAGFCDLYDTNYERSRRLQSEMEGLLSYKPPPPDYYFSLKKSLGDIRSKMNNHRLMLDRYNNYDVGEKVTSVSDGISAKSNVMVERMPKYDGDGYKLRTADYYTTPKNVTWNKEASNGLPPSVNSTVSESRSKIRKILSKTRSS